MPFSFGVCPEGQHHYVNQVRAFRCEDAPWDTPALPPQVSILSVTMDFPSEQLRKKTVTLPLRLKAQPQQMPPRKLGLRGTGK